MKTKLFLFVAALFMAVTSANAQQFEEVETCWKETTQVVDETETYLNGGFGWSSYLVCTTIETTCRDNGNVSTSTNCETEIRVFGISITSAKEDTESLSKYNNLVSNTIPAPGTCTPCRSGKQICNKNGQIKVESCEDQIVTVKS